ncbi:MAG: LysR family transcriptional regulator, partial [Syntrophomonadaceae bacterium]|nr:LysR family transcriptional regulator [Syntrophomonadaceae bacterium]
MNLNLLLTFVQVVEKRSLSAAARDLFLSQPAVSKHVQALEDLYGVQLLERVGYRIRPTETGEVLYRYAREVLRVLEELDDALTRTATGVRGRLAIGASTVPGNYILPSIIGRFKRVYPMVQITLEIGDSEKMTNQLLEQRFDLVVVGAPVRHRKLIS